MLQVNRNKISVAEHERNWHAYLRLPHLQKPQGKRFALCISDAAQLISLVLFLKEHGSSILLMHGGMPLEAALTTSEGAGCAGLIYQEPATYFANNGSAAVITDNKAKIYQFSSGTTGHPKLIGRSWDIIQDEIASYNEAIGLSAEVVPIVLTPVTHSYGLLCGVLASLARGAEPIVVTNANPKLTLALIRDFPDHIVYGVPAQLQTIAALSHGQAKLNKLMSSGMPMSVRAFEQLGQTGSKLLQQYGCSEAGCISLSTGMRSAHDLGLPLRKWKVSVASTEGESLMKGTRTPAELVAESAELTVRTGDLGLVHADGTLTYVSRLDDVINVGGLKVYPLEVEAVIAAMPGIRENVIYRGNHPIAGDKVRCMAVAEEKIQPESVREWCLKRLPAYKVPLEITLVSEIPKGATGKISRRQLELEEAVQC
ncbi:fatty-acyl-CoA synthase [Paenibacillus endophyticus]|uniref:Fatty-acyl-CoA synthase n=1 Tax=Paenibacillus endophyticus TaxID=1294268 RepID=A0A7W5CBZ8_9BACL|nr:AMP-binding protein [Paenibacillus endophyticus]MBB3154918.1 fatty-acyl-CoA synthase [Paenibacillus endophyticus]